MSRVDERFLSSLAHICSEASFSLDIARTPKLVSEGVRQTLFSCEAWQSVWHGHAPTAQRHPAAAFLSDALTAFRCQVHLLQ